MKNVGARMKTLRENMNLTPQAVSSYLDVPCKDLLDIEEGNMNITLSILNKLCSLFDAVKVICYAGAANLIMKNLHLEAQTLKQMILKALQA